MSKAKKPKNLVGKDLEAECLPGDTVFETHPVVSIQASEVYTSKDLRRLRKWLVKAEAWLKDRE